MVATRPLDCKRQATVAVICLLSDNDQRKGERTDRWLGLARPIIKYNRSLLYENSFCLGKQGFCVGSLGRDKGCKSPEMLCKTRIVFSDEYSAMDIPNRAIANETRSLYCTERSVLGISLKDASESTVMAPPTNPNSADSSAKQSLEAGLAALKQQDYPTAIALLEPLTQTAANGPSGIRAQMGLVAAYKATGNLKKAIALCSSLKIGRAVQQ